MHENKKKQGFMHQWFLRYDKRRFISHLAALLTLTNFAVVKLILQQANNVDSLLR